MGDEVERVHFIARKKQGGTECNVYLHRRTRPGKPDKPDLKTTIFFHLRCTLPHLHVRGDELTMVAP